MSIKLGDLYCYVLLVFGWALVGCAFLAVIGTSLGAVESVSSALTANGITADVSTWNSPILGEVCEVVIEAPAGQELAYFGKILYWSAPIGSIDQVTLNLVVKSSKGEFNVLVPSVISDQVVNLQAAGNNQELVKLTKLLFDGAGVA